MPPAPVQATGGAAAPAGAGAAPAARAKPPQNYIWTIARVLLLWWFIRCGLTAAHALTQPAVPESSLQEVRETSVTHLTVLTCRRLTRF